LQFVGVLGVGSGDDRHKRLPWPHLDIRGLRVAVIHGDAEVEGAVEIGLGGELGAGAKEDAETASVDGNVGLGLFPDGGTGDRGGVKAEDKGDSVGRGERLPGLVRQLALERDDVGVLSEGLAAKEREERKEGQA